MTSPEPRPVPAGDPRVVLYVREACHLCEDARAVVGQACAEAGERFVERDVDADPALRAEYGELVPVVTVDGVRQGYWRLDGDRVRRALAR
ncbi:glutaredoxin family protein [Luteimicrobium xylanilyticum]|uniref:glutaredoxin family protein n=1 Tax=Luteimicrobium xylanilyticum TaxID=1133546 RepID=UPI0004B20BE2|nr:glutaredoxin family protein [Luteimicrobium xylanilyticum]